MSKKSKGHDSISTFLGPEAAIEGTLEFRGTIRVDGKLTGKVNSKDGTVIVGEKAVIDADISVGVAVVMGSVNGTIQATDRIEIYPPGKVAGDMQAPVVSIEEGGLFNGNCSMREPAGVTPLKSRESGKMASGE
jgi:cytoskeletal protein CcmA (bactofilin family)